MTPKASRARRAFRGHEKYLAHAIKTRNIKTNKSLAKIAMRIF
jgi:hypothetical protein